MLETLHLANSHCPECRAEIDSWWDLTSEIGLRVARASELRIVIQNPSQDSNAVIWVCCTCGNRERTSEAEITVENNTDVDVGAARRESPVTPVTGEGRRNEEVIPRPRSFLEYFDFVSVVILLLGLGYFLLQKKLAWDFVFGLYSSLIWTILAME